MLSTHDQILGGPHGQTYVGCRLPADPAYATAIGVRHARSARLSPRWCDRAIRGRLRRRRRNGSWELYAVEINLRNGGTTHPVLTLQALTGGEYEEASASLRREALRRDRRPRGPGAGSHRTTSGHRGGARLGWDRRRAPARVPHGERDRGRGRRRCDSDRRLAAEATRCTTARSEPCVTRRLNSPRGGGARFPPVAAGSREPCFCAGSGGRSSSSSAAGCGPLGSDGDSRRRHRNRCHIVRGRCLHGRRQRTLEENMASNTRIPKAEITGIYGGAGQADDPQDARRGGRAGRGDVAQPARCSTTCFGFGRKVQKWDRLRREPEVVRATWPSAAWSAAASAWTSTTSWPTTRGSTRPRRARSRGGGSPTSSRRWSAT